MRQSQVENEDYSVFNWLYSISSPTVMLGQLRPNVSTSLADRLKLLKTKYELPESSIAELHPCKCDKSGKKPIEIIFDFYLGLPHIIYS